MPTHSYVPLPLLPALYAHQEQYWWQKELKEMIIKKNYCVVVKKKHLKNIKMNLACFAMVRCYIIYVDKRLKRKKDSSM